MKKTVAGVLVIGILGLMSGIGTAGARQRSVRQAPSAFNYSGGAYGTYAFVGSTVTSARTSVVGLGCGAGAGAHNSASAGQVNGAPLLTTGAIQTSVDTDPTITPGTTTTSSDVAGASLLGGLISSTEVKAISATTGSASITHSAAGSTLAGLVVNGVAMAGTPPPNTTIDLPGVGKVVLNEQTQAGNSLTVNMIHVFVTAAQPGIPAQTQVIVGHAVSSLAPKSTATLSETAFTARATGGGIASVGPQWVLGLCGSTNGKTKTISGVGLNFPGMFNSGAASNTVNGIATATTAFGKSTASVKNLTMLSNLVTADSVDGLARVTEQGSTVTKSTAGSSFGNLVVNGQAMSGTVPANTQRKVGNVTVWLRREIRRTNGITVRMIEVIVNGTNPFGLPVGADIQVASASTTLFPLS
jgi:hypothetical protein